MSYELQGESLKVRVNIQNSEFISTSYEFKFTFNEFIPTSYEFKSAQVTSSNPQVTSSSPRRTSSNPRVQGSLNQQDN